MSHKRYSCNFSGRLPLAVPRQVRIRYKRGWRGSQHEGFRFCGGFPVALCRAPLVIEPAVILRPCWQVPSGSAVRPRAGTRGPASRRRGRSRRLPPTGARRGRRRETPHRARSRERTRAPLPPGEPARKPQSPQYRPRAAGPVCPRALRVIIPSINLPIAPMPSAWREAAAGTPASASHSARNTRDTGSHA